MPSLLIWPETNFCPNVAHKSKKVNPCGNQLFAKTLEAFLQHQMLNVSACHHKELHFVGNWKSLIETRNIVRRMEVKVFMRNAFSDALITSVV